LGNRKCIRPVKCPASTITKSSLFVDFGSWNPDLNYGNIGKFDRLNKIVVAVVVAVAAAAAAAVSA